MAGLGESRAGGRTAGGSGWWATIEGIGGGPGRAWGRRRALDPSGRKSGRTGARRRVGLDLLDGTAERCAACLVASGCFSGRFPVGSRRR